MGSIRRSLPKVKTKKKKKSKKIYTLCMYNIYLSWNSAYQSIFAKPPCHTAAAEKKITTFFCLSYALLPILKSTKLFGSKEKNTNLLLNSNDLQQRKKKERTVKCTFSSPPNHAIVAYTPFYKV